jgi:hypothetical protein
MGPSTTVMVSIQHRLFNHAGRLCEKAPGQGISYHAMQPFTVYPNGPNCRHGMRLGCDAKP